MQHVLSSHATWLTAIESHFDIKTRIKGNMQNKIKTILLFFLDENIWIQKEVLSQLCASQICATFNRIRNKQFTKHCHVYVYVIMIRLHTSWPLWFQVVLFYYHYMFHLGFFEMCSIFKLSFHRQRLASWICSSVVCCVKHMSHNFFCAVHIIETVFQLVESV